MGPINYMAAMPQEDFLRDIQGGLTLGSAIQTQQLQRQQLAQKLAMQQQYQQGVSSFLQNPTPKGALELGMRFPEQHAAIKEMYGALSAEQQQSELKDTSELLAMLHTGNTDLAKDRLKARADMMKNAGQDPAPVLSLLNMVEADPKQAYAYALHTAAGLPGGDKMLSNLSTLGQEQRAQALAPAQEREAAAKAATAEVGAKYAEQGAILDLQKKGWDIKALQADIDYKRESNRIAAMNAAIAREGNSLKAQELRLKVDEAIQKRDDKVREKVATAEAGASSIDNMLNTIERLKKSPDLGAVVGGINGRLPAVADGSIDAVALIETIGSQAFLAQIPNIKGMGALSNAEGEKLQSALTNLSRVQSEKQFRTNLDEAARLLNKGRQSLSRSTGVPLGKPDTPAAPGARPPLDSFYKQ